MKYFKKNFLEHFQFQLVVLMLHKEKFPLQGLDVHMLLLQCNQVNKSRI